MLSHLSVRKPYTVLVAVILILVLGAVSLTGMNTDLLPGIELPYVAVMTSYPGASPEKVESTLTRPLEAALGTAPGLSSIQSVSRENSSMIFMEFVQGTNMDSAMIDLSGRVDLVSGQLDDAVGAPTLLRISPDMLPVMVASADREGADLAELSALVEDDVVPSLERLPGVASVSASGLLERQIRVELDDARIDALQERIDAALAREMEPAGAELEQAEAELESGRAALETELPAQQDKLVQGSADLQQAIARMEALLAQEDLLLAQQTALEQQQSAIQAALDAQQPVAQILPATDGDLSSGDYLTLLSQSEDEIRAALADLSPDQQQEQLTQLSDTVTLLGNIEAELQSLDTQLQVLGAMKPELEQALDQTMQGYREVEAGKITMAVETATARARLDRGAEQLAAAREEWTTASENAKGQLDLRSMLSAERIASLLQAQHFSMPAGSLQAGAESVVVKVGDPFASVQELEDTVLLHLDLIGDVRLSDLADIRETDNAMDSYARINGNDGIVLTLQKQSTASTSDVSSRILGAMGELEDRYDGLRLLPLMDQGDYIRIITGGVTQNLLWGGLLAVLILLLFLRDIRPTLVIAISIPVSLLFALTLMYFTGVTLNVISLSGLALGIGMLVDNSIVVIENIDRLRRSGHSAMEAAIQGARQMSGAITASTLTTICVFLPIVFTEGLSRQLFSDMGLTIAYSLLASLAVAITVVPAMSATALRRTKEKTATWITRLTEAYRTALRFTLRHKTVILVPVILLFALSLFGITVMGTAFIPEMDSPQMSATLEMPRDTTREDFYAAADEMTGRILEIEAVEYVGGMSSGGSFMGFGGPGSSSDTSVSFYILLREERNQTNRDVEREILSRTEDMSAEISVSASNMDMSMLGGSGITVRVKGQDLDVLRETATDVAELLRGTEGIGEVTTGLEDSGREIRVTVDKDAAAREELTVAQVYASLADTLRRDRQAIVLSRDGEDRPVLIVPATTPPDADTLADHELTYTGRDGSSRSACLSDIAAIEEAPGLDAVLREGQSRYMEVAAVLAEGYNIGLVSRDVEAAMDTFDTPEGVQLEMGGENETIQDALGDIVLMAALAMLFIYLIMVAQFQSLLSPFIVLFILPLAFTGGLLLLWGLGMELSVIAALGFLVLAGIVVNNGIVFISSIHQYMEEGMDQAQALVESGTTRLRPILMTAITTILAMSTLALGWGTGSEMTQPMAVVAIGGLTYATVLTLFVVPVMFDLLHRKKATPAPEDGAEEGTV